MPQAEALRLLQHWFQGHLRSTLAEAAEAVPELELCSPALHNVVRTLASRGHAMLAEEMLVCREAPRPRPHRRVAGPMGWWRGHTSCGQQLAIGGRRAHCQNSRCQGVQSDSSVAGVVVQGGSRFRAY